MRQAGWYALHMSAVEVFRVGLFCCTIFLIYSLAFRWSIAQIRGRQPSGRLDKAFLSGWVGAALLSAAVAGALCMVYGFFVEPKRLTVTYYSIETPKIAKGERVRIVHLADLHVRQNGPRERALPELVRSLNPDLILHTGDFFGPMTGLEPVIVRVLRSWNVPQYACEGNLDCLGDFYGVMKKAGVTVLADRIAQQNVRSARFSIAGFPSLGEDFIHRKLMELPRDTFNIVLYHHPQGFPETWGTPADLMLAGHTHGGQVRLPWYGALITFDEFGKRWEGGFYDENGVKLVVSRGIGCEPSVPEVRFLCPPEVDVIDLIGAG